jgi:TonB-dependent receptor
LTCTAFQFQGDVVKDRKTVAQAAVGLLGLCAAAALAQAQEQNQTTPAPPAAASSGELQEVVVTGFRRSLTESTDAKRDATGFIDQINAEDIGKFPDTNIAESFNRIPGITISRDITGQGTDISIRGLGTNFTKVLLNGAPVAVASTGPTDAQNTNREVDLDLFPTELFTQLTVQKTSSAAMLEGGAAGTVNMRSARPFDNPGEHLTYSAQMTQNQGVANPGERGALIGSKTWDNGLGVLVGVTGVTNRIDVKGFETIGWTNPNLSVVTAPSTSNPAGISAAQAQCLASTCNGTGGGNWTIPAKVPAGAGNGLNTGDVINQAFLLAHNPGLSITQIDNAIIPRLGRPSDEVGSQDRVNGVASFEYRPTDDLHFFVDTMYGHKKNNERRFDMDWVGRNGAAIPLNMTVDRSDCTTGCVVTSGTFANAQQLLEYRPYIETVNFYGVNPGVNWTVNDWLKMDLQANKTESTFHREVPSVLVGTALGNGMTVNFNNNGGGVPTITSNVNLDDPANFGWNSGTRVNIQDERRSTQTKGVRGNFTFGKGKDVNLQAGFAYDDILRNISATDNSQAWQNAVCGDNPSTFVPGPNAQPACDGLVTAAPPASYPRYPGLGTRLTSGQPTTFTYQGSLVPTGSVPQYLYPSPAGFVAVNWPAFAGAANYPFYHNASYPNALQTVTSSNTGANAGFVEEKTKGFYLMLVGDTMILDHRLRYDAGARYVRTDQTIGGFVSVPDNRNPPNPPSGENPADGGLYPNVLNFVHTENTYKNMLPSGELAFNATDNTILRLAVSRTMTRPDPSAMLPGVAFSQPSADTGSVGNPALAPFISENFDLGVEYYTGQEGYVSATAFRKRLSGFTANQNTTFPFNYLAQYGITYATLSPTQQQAITSRGGPDAASVVLTEQVNASGALTVNGYELNWVQPLDFLLDRFNLDGFGFTANYTLVDQHGTGAAPATALGVAPHTYNVTAYYEHGPWMARISTVFNEGSQISTLNQNGIPLAALFEANYTEWDWSSSVDLSKLLGWSHQFQITFDATNLFDAKLRQYFQFSNATFTQYNPGRTLTIGFRGKF